MYGGNVHRLEGLGVDSSKATCARYNISTLTKLLAIWEDLFDNFYLYWLVEQRGCL